MKLVKQVAGLALAFVMTLGFAACTPKEFEHKKLVDFCEEHDIDEADDLEKFFTRAGGLLNVGSTIDDEGIYYSCTDSEAEDVYDTLFNRFGEYRDCDVEKTTSFVFCNKNGYYLVCLFTMEDEKDAEKLFKEFEDVKEDDDDAVSGKDKNCSYIISNGENSKGKSVVAGFYMRKNTVLIIRGIYEDSDFVDDLCKEYKIKSPSESEER